MQVNLAARLMNVAYKTGEGILCDHATFLAASSPRFGLVHQFKQLEPIQVKGKEKKVSIYKPLGQIAASSMPVATKVLILYFIILFEISSLEHLCWKESGNGSAKKDYKGPIRK
jgi:hypothetical protein